MERRQPITAQDYKFTFDKMMDPNVDFPYRPLCRPLREPHRAGRQHAGHSGSRSRSARRSTTPSFDPIPKHVFENLDINDNPLNQKPTVGSGPWLLQEWRKDTEAVFVANDKFYLGRPNLDR